MIGKNTGLPILSGEYNRGFTAALLKILSDYEDICESMKFYKKRMTEKLTKQWLKCCLENREKLRDINNVGRYQGFIRWNKQTEKFEWFDPELNKKENDKYE